MKMMTRKRMGAIIFYTEYYATAKGGVRLDFAMKAYQMDSDALYRRLESEGFGWIPQHSCWVYKVGGRK
jgi:hypothetical protein